ncbi:MAG: hypothetical protein EBY18_05905 [Alphaproteobacteria bacterium]|nr:hypothetical protein [Alphaproteobacteria bacterium]
MQQRIESAPSYVSAMIFEFSKQQLVAKGTPVGKFCMVIDVVSDKFFPGATSTKARLREVQAACGEVFAL